jgi:hypothetical protein
MMAAVGFSAALTALVLLLLLLLLLGVLLWGVQGV